MRHFAIFAIGWLVLAWALNFTVLVKNGEAARVASEFAADPLSTIVLVVAFGPVSYGLGWLFCFAYRVRIENR